MPLIPIKIYQYVLLKEVYLGIFNNGFGFLVKLFCKMFADETKLE